MKERDRVRRAWRKHKKPELHKLFKRLRNRVQSLIRDAKENYYQTVFSQKRDTVSTWGELRRLGLVSSSSGKNRCNFDLDELNVAFILSTSAGSDIESGDLNWDPDALDVERFDDTCFFFADISPKALRDAIFKGRFEAMDIDKISTKCLTIAFSVLLSYLLKLFNFMLQNSRYPELWKLALIRPLPKVKSLISFTNFRPISLLCTLSKALERIVFDQIVDYLETKNLFELPICLP
ncbi:reverse transcriptase [Lasius niger]|uniref:Reverse transcriptase n=1 Tax=Lasius niger TaxID=67767 RepID=A0A0J7NFG9_LASNI|nr:reverse transcriptase [Lasius niger]